ncbi:ABC transporter ATP-binding protein [Candidatus Xianfuyuplasma coldseepsis]|uniref:ABC transporter ATP-binding protein n=1 Tax=Candidatus Xianfuyuplasma coldseepsis TaxID=2782163 RepID=A0A7L7KPB2_9MOLU|nr:ABC transporter ATP-binding protein [Xianfuyuplasma coldseepsis]QMS84497.1 ABC transporter ATP-binding protein [Xianfuyuplasma coldseepsis]
MLRLENISKYYHSNDVVALGLRKVSLEFKLGEFVAVTGESGSGKSTLLNVISGLDTYEDGEMYVNGEETSYYTIEEWESYRRQYIGFVFQNYNIIDSYSVLENVMVALTIQGYDKDKRKERALELIDKVGLTSHVHHKASKLSGGQKQRAVIARALAKDCPIIVADEPTGNLDSESGRKIIELLQEISQDKLVIVVTHNYQQVAEYATRRIRLFDGEVVEDKVMKPRQDITEGVTLANYRMSIPSLMMMALRNLYRTPRRSIFTLVIGIFIAAIFYFSYGSYVQESTSSGFSYDYWSIYNNTPDGRIIVTKFDQTPFTDQEIEDFENMNRVMGVLEHDVLFDTPIYVYMDSEWDGGWIESWYYYVNPSAMLRQDDLDSGVLPANKNEVVVGYESEFEVGETIDVGYEYPRYTKEGDYTLDGLNTYRLTVVGKTKNSVTTTNDDFLYLHDEFLSQHDVIITNYLSRERWPQLVSLGMKIDINGTTVNFGDWYEFEYDSSMELDEMILSPSLAKQLCAALELDYTTQLNQCLSVDVSITGTSLFYENQLDYTITGVMDDLNEEQEEYYNIVRLHPESLSSLVSLEPYQISLLVRDGNDANIVMNAIQEDITYNAIYPAGIEVDDFALMSLLLGIWFAARTLMLMIVMYFITYVVLRNIQNAKVKGFLIFRSIGASKKDLHKVTNIELVYLFVAAIVLVLLFAAINQINQIWIIPQYLHFFTVGSYVLLIALLSALAILLGRRFNKRIFGQSVITSLKQE